MSSRINKWKNTSQADEMSSTTGLMEQIYQDETNSSRGGETEQERGFRAIKHTRDQVFELYEIIVNRLRIYGQLHYTRAEQYGE